MTAPDSFVEQASPDWVNDAMEYVDDIVRYAENDYQGSLADAKKDLRAALIRQAARCKELEEALQQVIDSRFEDDDGRIRFIDDVLEAYVLDAARSVLSQKEQG